MLLKSFVQRPQSVAARKLLFQIHLWVGVVLALYVLVIGITGAAVVFRPEMQSAAYPQFFRVDRSSEQPDAEAPAILQALQSAYPDHHLVGIDWPTYRRQTSLAYVTRDNHIRTVFVDPRTATVLGELSEQSWTRWLQELHFNLLGGPTGLVVNGIGAICLLVMCVTGLVIWWPGIDRWRQSLTVDFSKGWKRVNWELHGASGFWMVALFAMWAITGIYFAFPQPFRTFVNSLSPLTVLRAPESNPSLDGKQPAPEPLALIAMAQQLVPGAKMARFIPPSGPRGTYLIVMARNVHGDSDASDEVQFYFDQYSGGLLQTRDQGQRTAGDVVMAWVGPLHVGSFGGSGAVGLGVKIVWALTALGFPLMAMTGILMWWNRVFSDKWARTRQLHAGKARFSETEA